jgi:hypothetical protein
MVRTARLVRLVRLLGHFPQEHIASLVVPHYLRPFLLHRCISVLVSAPQSHVFSNLLPRNLVGPPTRCRSASGSKGLVVV